MKTCQKCKQELPLTSFTKNKARVDGLQSYCRPCNKVRSAQMYAQNKAYYIAKNNVRTAAMRKENRRMVYEYLLNHPCVDCGEIDPVVLEFDHLRDKLNDISQMVRGGFSWSTIEAEIEKCEVRCANCHRRVTAERANWWITNPM